MKYLAIPIVCVASAVSASAGILYSDLNDASIPFFGEAGLEGVYINVLDGTVVTSRPLDFDTVPWINLFQGGTAISNSPLVRPWASEASYQAGEDGHYFLNLEAFTTTVDVSGVFVTEETASIGHVGAGADQFQSGVQGYLGFAYDLPLGGGVAYGWLRLTANDSGDGVALDFARSDLAGEAILVGAIPEPSAAVALAGVVGLGVTALRRRRRAA